jgi:hypothetical protein
MFPTRVANKAYGSLSGAIIERTGHFVHQELVDAVVDKTWPFVNSSRS